MCGKVWPKSLTVRPLANSILLLGTYVSTTKMLNVMRSTSVTRCPVGCKQSGLGGGDDLHYLGQRMQTMKLEKEQLQKDTIC